MSQLSRKILPRPVRRPPCIPTFLFLHARSQPKTKDPEDSLRFSFDMNVLESSLEALALNYLSLGFLTAVNNLWTWVAVLTAAVSFWRIRASGGSTQFHGNDRSPTRPAQVPKTLVANVSADESSSPAPSPANGIVSGEVGLDGVTKGTKFVAVYDEDADQKGNGELAPAENDEYYYYLEESGGAECRGIGKWGKSWERELRTRTAEKDWYSYQDLRVVNGNVVRLWENTASSVFMYKGSKILQLELY